MSFLISDFLGETDKLSWEVKRKHYLDLVREIHAPKNPSAFSLEDFLTELKGIGWSDQEREAIKKHASEPLSNQFGYLLNLDGMQVILGRRYTHHVQLDIMDYAIIQFRNATVSKKDNSLAGEKGFEYLSSSKLGIFDEQRLDGEIHQGRIQVMQQNLPFIEESEGFGNNYKFSEEGIKFFDDFVKNMPALLEIPKIESEDRTHIDGFLDKIKRSHSGKSLSLYSFWHYT